MIDRRTMITAALAAITIPVSTRTVLAQAAMSRITAYVFSFLRWRGAISGSRNTPAVRFWWSTRPHCVVSRRNMPDCRNCGPSFGVEA
jgi:hypothetical protein